jgi:hypothetical protein
MLACILGALLLLIVCSLVSCCYIPNLNLARRREFPVELPLEILYRRNVPFDELLFVSTIPSTSPAWNVNLVLLQMIHCVHDIISGLVF